MVLGDLVTLRAVEKFETALPTAAEHANTGWTTRALLIGRISIPKGKGFRTFASMGGRRPKVPGPTQPNPCGGDREPPRIRIKIVIGGLRVFICGFSDVLGSQFRKKWKHESNVAQVELVPLECSTWNIHGLPVCCLCVPRGTSCGNLGIIHCLQQIFKKLAPALKSVIAFKLKYRIILPSLSVLPKNHGSCHSRCQPEGWRG